MEHDYCGRCDEYLDVEFLIVTECGKILCASCAQRHDCEECCPSEADSDSDYTPTATSESEESEEEASDDE
jgi:hypothetical protein